MHGNSCCHPRRRAPEGRWREHKWSSWSKGIVSVLLVKDADIAAESQISSIELVAVFDSLWFHTFHSQMHLCLSLSLSLSLSLFLSLAAALFSPSFSSFSLSLSLCSRYMSLSWHVILHLYSRLHNFKVEPICTGFWRPYVWEKLIRNWPSVLFFCIKYGPAHSVSLHIKCDPDWSCQVSSCAGLSLWLPCRGHSEAAKIVEDPSICFSEFREVSLSKLIKLWLVDLLYSATSCMLLKGCTFVAIRCRTLCRDSCWGCRGGVWCPFLHVFSHLGHLQ